MARTSDVVDGLQILGKYAERGSHIGGADHDIIYGPKVDQYQPSEADRNRLEEMDWFWDEGNYCWARYC